MKSSTNRALVAKKQIFTKSNRLTAMGKRIAIVLTLLFTLGIGQVWAVSEGSNWYDANSAKVYFDNTNSSYAYVSLLIGRQWNYGSDGVGSSGINFSKISGTNNLYYASVTFTKYTTMCFINATNWGWEGNKVTDRCTYATDGKYTNTSNDNLSNTTHLYIPASGIANANLTHNSLSGYSALNSQQTIHSAVNGAVANSKATISITSYKMTAHKTTTEQTATLGTGANVSYIDAARTATTTLTVGDVETGYQFDGWYTAATGGTQLETDKTYTYYPAAATTVYARFSAKTYTVKWVVDGQEKARETAVAHGSKPDPNQAPEMDPNDPTCGDKFVGWVTDPIEGQLKDASELTIYATDNLPAITDETTFYAVFANYEE